MTWFVTFRSQGVGGAVNEPKMIDADDRGAIELSPADVERRAISCDILLAAHGFNVSREEGIRSLARLEARLRPSESELFIGVLWPGDFWIPVVNYPAEAADAVKCGTLLAQYCDSCLGGARSISLLSHSLGGRLMLETAANLGRRAKSVCLTAAAVDWDCLDDQYAAAVANAGSITTLSSRNDMVLKLAYPVGDLVSDLFLGDTDRPFTQALGVQGPRPKAPDGVVPWQIPDTADYGHHNYFPPSDSAPPSHERKWETAVDFMVRTFREQPLSWP